MSTQTASDRPHFSDSSPAMLARNWWVVGLRGGLGILFGVVALFMTGSTILSLVLVFSAYMFVDGAFTIVSGVRAARQGERWGLLILEGIAGLAAGTVAFLWPGITVVAFALVLAAWSLVSGALALAAAFRLDASHGRWWFALSGIASIVLAAVLIVAPLIGAIVLTWWIGAYALVVGSSLLILAFNLRRRQDERQPQAQAG